MQRLAVSRFLSCTIVGALLALSCLPASAAADSPAAAPSSAAPTSDAYLIHGGDELHIVVFGEADLTKTVTVPPSGTIDYPLIGEVNVRGLTPDQAADTMATDLKRFLRSPHVSVQVDKEGPLEVLVLGNVANPGKYELPSRSRVTDALATAGGLGATDGDFPDARLADSHGNVTQVSLQKLLHDGDTAQNKQLGDEMTVYVPNALTLQVQVLGAVDKPGDVLVHEGDRLSMAIARAGNSKNSNADLNHITLRRVGSDGQTKTMNFNLYDILKSGDISRDPLLQKDDLVYVPQSAGHTDRTSGWMSTSTPR